MVSCWRFVRMPNFTYLSLHARYEMVERFYTWSWSKLDRHLWVLAIALVFVWVISESIVDTYWASEAEEETREGLLIGLAFFLHELNVVTSEWSCSESSELSPKVCAVRVCSDFFRIYVLHQGISSSSQIFENSFILNKLFLICVGYINELTCVILYNVL